MIKMLILGKQIVVFIMLVLSGVIAVYLSFPVLEYVFDVQIVIKGATPLIGMYMYLVSSMIVTLGIFIAVGIPALIIGGIIWLIMVSTEKKRKVKHLERMIERQEAYRQRHSR